MIFLKKYMEIWYFLQMFWKDGLSKKNLTGTSFSFYYLETWYVFTRKYNIFSLDGKWKMIFLKKYMEIWYFLYICINVTNMILPFCKKKKSRMIFSRKNTLTADWHSRSHSRKGFNDFLYFYGDLHRHFHMLLSSEKKSGNLIYTIEIWLLLQFIW